MDKFLLCHTFLRDYDSHLIMQDIDKFDVKIIVILKGLKNTWLLRLIQNLVFIDSMQFMNSSLDTLVKNLSDIDFRYLFQQN